MAMTYFSYENPCVMKKHLGLFINITSRAVLEGPFEQVALLIKFAK